ncbi:peptidoglycan DD-metalloendopeptidase family protein [Asanoa siamensis]|uniref:M23ase beta-sheet core domain-containing protein n=1 Tax=Asanoa siamensis TaxID=926357 RepID=A0ABQ4CSB8_9ACTN|nr:peptidoglycan DD-metalloendopeptidase family protein [Asanoa siamensis]GIF74184.1 hypothetical protein Asi02nite_37020 [Asanoa siamensis]
MSGDREAGPPRGLMLLAIGALVVVMVCSSGLLVIGGAVGGGLTATPPPTQGTPLRPDAPVPPQYLSWVLKAGALCPELGPGEIAAQIDLESGWNRDAVAHNPASRGGDAMGIAQFQQGTWASWGGDRDQDGRNSPFDAEDAILAMGHLMCDLAEWASQNVEAQHLRGDLLDLAWASYFCGRGCVLAAGGVPAAGLAHDYPGKVRERLAKYGAPNAGGVPVGPGGWTLPLKPGTYSVGSGFGNRWGRLHAGVDLMAKTGTPIYAAAAGTVLDAGCTSAYCDRPGSLNLPGCGLRINLGHAGRIVTRYCHAVRLNVREGQRVAAGQIIAWVGSTGHSSGPHLHFEVHHSAPPASNDNAENPITFLRKAGLRP